MADEKKTYTLTTATVPARPRSKTRREGEGLTTGGASAIVESATVGNAQRAAHSETANEAAHAAEAAHALNADNAKNATHADEATHAAHAETATSATTSAHSNTADAASRAQSAQTADHAATAATAERAAHATEAETLRTPNYSDGLNTGAGARIDATGNAEFQSMAVRGFFRAAEYQINRIALSEGDVFHTENGLVKSAEQQSDGRWKVVLQERFQGDVTGFRAGDVLRGAYNSVGTSGGAAEIRTSWLRVEAVDAKAGTLTASLYADNQTPEGRNAPPVPLMRLARWGNTTDPERQSHIVESATEGRIVRRVKVSAPIVDGAQSDGFVVGKLPAWLREHFGAAVAGASDYVFARGIITQNLLRYTPAGRPLAERVDRGLWNASARYFYEEQNPETGAFEISRVWHDGALYELARGGNGNTAPAANSTHWTLIQAKPKDGEKGDAGKSAPPTNPNLLNYTRTWRHPNGHIAYKTKESGERVSIKSGGKHGSECFRVEADPSAPLGNNGVYAWEERAGQSGLSQALRENQWYTVSYWIRGRGIAQVAFYMLDYKGGNDAEGASYKGNFFDLRFPEKEGLWPAFDLDLSEEWQQVRVKIRPTRDYKNHWFFVALGNNQKSKVDWLELCCVKIEEGEIATPWCVSEEDKIGADGRDGESYHANLLEDSAFKKGFDQWNPEGRLGVLDDTQTSPVPGTRVVRYDTAMLGDLPFASIVQNVSGRLRPNTTYTLSVWVKTSQELKRATILFAFKPFKFLDIYYQHGGEWTRCAITFTTFPEKNDNQSIRLRLNRQEGAASVWFAAPKLEIGDTPTEWTTSENDRKGERGEPGAKGDNGRGIDRIETFYLLTPDGTAPEPGVRDWKNTPRVPTPQTPWLWTYERVVYSDGTSVRTPVRLDTRLARNGADAEPTRPNLLDGTDFRQLGRKESAWNIGTHGEEPVAGRADISIFSSAVDGCVPALCAINPGTKEGEFAQLSQNVGQLIPGRTYTFSAYVRGADVAWLIVYPTPAEHFHPNTVKQDDWTRVSLIFRAPEVQAPDGVLLLLRAWHRETTPHTGYAKNVVWCAPKLEEGGGATQWCPSFRDQRGADGSPGARGATVRPLGDYARLADGTPFESGHAGEIYLDVVQVRQGEQVQFYQCKQPHTKSADKAPAVDSEWWELSTYQGFVATDLLLSKRSLIKNLQVEDVVGHDERGNVTFELDSETGTAYFGGTATFAGFIRRRPVVITPENWKEYGGRIERDWGEVDRYGRRIKRYGDFIYLNPFAVGTYVIFRGNFGALRPTINTGPTPLADGYPEKTRDNSHLMRYYGSQFMVYNDTPTSLYVGDLEIIIKQHAIFTMLGQCGQDVLLWWKGEIVEHW